MTALFDKSFNLTYIFPLAELSCRNNPKFLGLFCHKVKKKYPSGYNAIAPIGLNVCGPDNVSLAAYTSLLQSLVINSNKPDPTIASMLREYCKTDICW